MSKLIYSYEVLLTFQSALKLHVCVWGGGGGGGLEELLIHFLKCEV